MSQPTFGGDDEDSPKMIVHPSAARQTACAPHENETSRFRSGGLTGGVLVMQTPNAETTTTPCCWWCDEKATPRRPLVSHRGTVFHATCVAKFTRAQGFRKIVRRIKQPT